MTSTFETFACIGFHFVFLSMEVNVTDGSELFWPKSEADCANGTLLQRMDFSKWGER